MKGYIHIEAAKREDAEGISVTCNLEHPGTMDRFNIIESVCRALRLTEQEWMLFVCLKHEGIFDKLLDREGIELKLPNREGTQSEG